jgi:hypothetical protein
VGATENAIPDDPQSTLRDNTTPQQKAHFSPEEPDAAGRPVFLASATFAKSDTVGTTPHLPTATGVDDAPSLGKLLLDVVRKDIFVLTFQHLV